MTFKSLSSQSSKEQADPVEARAWPKEIEESFEILIDEAQKTVFITYLPKREATRW